MPRTEVKRIRVGYASREIPAELAGAIADHLDAGKKVMVSFSYTGEKEMKGMYFIEPVVVREDTPPSGHTYETCVTSMVLKRVPDVSVTYETTGVTFERLHVRRSGEL